AAGVALQTPDLVASLTLMEPAMTLHRIRLAYFGGLLASFVRKSPQRWNFLFERPAPEELIALADASRTFRPAAPLPTLFSDDELARLAMPLQVILAGRSTTSNPDRVRDRLSIHHRDAPVHVIPTAGHMVSVDAPVDVNRLLADWLRTV
ncbi:MAG: hypothetical protein Q4G35_13755, partial [Propionibacteriaceae bacterium]|nr:hypothetical protein [Propionibacteriaceae bacterium]